MESDGRECKKLITNHRVNRCRLRDYRNKCTGATKFVKMSRIVKGHSASRSSFFFLSSIVFSFCFRVFDGGDFQYFRLKRRTEKKMEERKADPDSDPDPDSEQKQFYSVFVAVKQCLRPSLSHIPPSNDLRGGVFRCVLASLYEVVSVGWSVGRMVRRSVGP